MASKQTKKVVLFGGILVGVALLVAYMAGLLPLGVFGDTLTIYNDDTYPVTCFVDIYNNGYSFTIPAGGSKAITLPVAGKITEGRCYCSDYRVNDPSTYTFLTTSQKFNWHVDRDCGGAGDGGGSTYCLDSDGGLNYNEQGTTRGYEDSVQVFTGNDNCLGDDQTLSEYYCEGNAAKATTYLCPNVCQGGECISGTPETCADHDLADDARRWDLIRLGYDCSEEWVGGVGWCYECVQGATTTTHLGTTTTYNPTTTTTQCPVYWAFVEGRCQQYRFCSPPTFEVEVWATKADCEKAKGTSGWFLFVVLGLCILFALLVVYIQGRRK